MGLKRALSYDWFSRKSQWRQGDPDPWRTIGNSITSPVVAQQKNFRYAMLLSLQRIDSIPNHSSARTCEDPRKNGCRSVPWNARRFVRGVVRPVPAAPFILRLAVEYAQQQGAVVTDPARADLFAEALPACF